MGCLLLSIALSPSLFPSVSFSLSLYHLLSFLLSLSLNRFVPFSLSFYLFFAFGLSLHFLVLSPSLYLYVSSMFCSVSFCIFSSVFTVTLYRSISFSLSFYLIVSIVLSYRILSIPLSHSLYHSISFSLSFYLIFSRSISFSLSGPLLLMPLKMSLAR